MSAVSPENALSVTGVSGSNRQKLRDRRQQDNFGKAGYITGVRTYNMHHYETKPYMPSYQYKLKNNHSNQEPPKDIRRKMKKAGIRRDDHLCVYNNGHIVQTTGPSGNGLYPAHEYTSRYEYFRAREYLKAHEYDKAHEYPPPKVVIRPRYTEPKTNRVTPAPTEQESSSDSESEEELIILDSSRDSTPLRKTPTPSSEVSDELEPEILAAVHSAGEDENRKYRQVIDSPMETVARAAVLAHAVASDTEGEDDAETVREPSPEQPVVRSPTPPMPTISRRRSHDAAIVAAAAVASRRHDNDDADDEKSDDGSDAEPPPRDATPAMSVSRPVTANIATAVAVAAVASSKKPETPTKTPPPEEPRAMTTEPRSRAHSPIVETVAAVAVVSAATSAAKPEEPVEAEQKPVAKDSEDGKALGSILRSMAMFRFKNK